MTTLDENPLEIFQRHRTDGFNVLLHSQTGDGWSYLVRTGEMIASLPPVVNHHEHDGKNNMVGIRRRGGSKTHPYGKSDNMISDNNEISVNVVAPFPPPFRSGWIVLITYDHGLGFEGIALPDRSMMTLPPILSLRAEEIVAVPPADSHAIIRNQAPGGPASLRASTDTNFELGQWTTRTPDADYFRMVESAKEYIAAGDIYQVNLARWFETDFVGDPFALFERLSQRNPSPYACYLDLPFLAEPTTIVSSSPELLFRIDGRRIVTRPIAGTYPRERDPVTLPRDPKERAEHIMLVDLERNDLGRVAVPGSVVVEELLGIETYSHLHHIVSQVAAELREAITLDEVLRSVFPGGTITGAPKIRAMEIISELEPVRRGLYTGAIGFVDDAGDATMNIVIRTAVIQNKKIKLAAGAGIVADSNPDREAAETKIKAASFGVQ
jgi:anthranilate synthase component 1